MAAIRTCLWFETDGEGAVDFYTGLLPDSRIDATHRPAADAPPVLIEFTLAGTPYSALNASGGPKPNESASIAAVLDSQDEADRLYDALLARGGKEVQCGWITDAWGISWQIIPSGMYQALFGPDEEANARAFAAMHTMKRLDLAAIHAARAQS